MGIRSSPRFHPYDASVRKTFKGAVCYLLHTEFPGIFGPTITRLFADKIDELFEPSLIEDALRHARMLGAEIVEHGLHG